MSAHPVIPMSTREWQRMKLGPSLRRDLRWTLVEAHLQRQRSMAAVRAVGRLASDLAVAFRPLMAQMAGLGRAFAAAVAGAEAQQRERAARQALDLE